jgi:hypothetical protein
MLPDNLTAGTVHLLAGGEVERRYGPPGTGKSTSLKRTIGELVAERGPDSVIVTSFTVTAAKSLAAMGLGLPDRQVGTLHSLAFRAIGTPDVALEPKILREWNARVGFEWRLTPDGRRGHPDTADSGAGGGSGDELLSLYDMARSQLVPAGEMPAEVRRFAQAWEGWKRSVSAVDFTDMILIALERALDGERAPGNPQVLISDEAQDMTPLETALVLAWGGLAGETIFALDDDQAINAWRGGDPAPILALTSGDGVNITDRILAQSYRIPSSVHAVSQSWIEACGNRRIKPYRPRDVTGQIYPVSYPIEAIPTAEAIARDAHSGRTVLVLAACEYMLRQLITNLKQIGVPFGNHYRPAESRWNPLSSAAGMTPAERLFRYLVLDERLLGDRSRLWTGDDVRAWLDLVSVKEAGLVRGAKTAAKLLPSGTLDIAQVEGLFASDEALMRATEPELGWLLECARGLKGMPEKLTYPAAVAKAHGPAALVDEPKVVVGTIHSVKGAGAQCVYLSPSVSGAGYQEWLRGGRARDNSRRQFYVGMTRAEQTCVVLGSSERSVPRAALIPPELMVR